MSANPTHSADVIWEQLFSVITELQVLKDQAQELKQQTGMSRDLLEPIPEDLFLSADQAQGLHRKFHTLVNQYLVIIKSTPAVYPCPPRLAKEQWKYKDLQGSGLYHLLSFQRALTYRKEERPFFPLPKVTEDLLRRWKFNWQTDGMKYRRMIARRIEYNLDPNPTAKYSCLDVRAEQYYFRASGSGKSFVYNAWETRIKSHIGRQHHWLFDDNVMPDLEWMCFTFHVGKLMEDENQYRINMERWEALDRETKGRLRDEAGRTEIGDYLISLSRLWGTPDLSKQVDAFLMLGPQTTYDSTFGNVLVGLVEEVGKSDCLAWALDRAGTVSKIPLEATLTRKLLNGIQMIKDFVQKYDLPVSWA